MTFEVDAETLYNIVNDHDQGPRLLHFSGDVQGLVKKLKTSLFSGLSDEEVLHCAARTDAFSTNELPTADEVTFMDLVKESLEDRMMQILIVSAVISLLLGLTVPDRETGLVDRANGWMEGAAILLSVALVTLVGSLNNYQKEQKFKDLTRATPPVRVKVRRAGKVVEISDRDLLVGDLLLATSGDVLTVDGIVLQSESMSVDESAATGENDDVTKHPNGDCFVRSGSYVVEGEGTVLVTGVGVNSLSGRIAMQVRSGSEETPLQEKLTSLADLIGYFGIVAAALMFVILSGMELYNTFVRRRHPFYYKKYLDNLTTAVTIVVVAVPEGLPLSVTIALAYSMKQMFKENNLVRHLAACETMGGATTICTDKTGTITQNRMIVTEGVTSYGSPFVVPLTLEDAEVHSPTTASTSVVVPDAANFESVLTTGTAIGTLRELLIEGIAVNSTATRKLVEDPKSHQGTVQLVGNKTEQAMLHFVERLREDPMAVRAAVLSRLREVPLESPFAKSIHEGGSALCSIPQLVREFRVFPFTSTRKRMTTALHLHHEGVVRYHMKGASEIVLSDCSHMLTATGNRETLGHSTRILLEESINALARRRLRTLAIAYAEVPVDHSSVGTDAPVRFLDSDEKLPGLTLLAIVGIRDPVRPEVPGAIARCRGAGVLVRMITGDNKTTAISIAKEVGIYGPVWSGSAMGQQGLALEGSQFRAFAKSERKLNAILPRLQVISRASPLDKQILVSALMRRGEVVAVTGDGTNDAPALKNAHVGFSMASGTEVAKNASDVVILDDNFSTIVTAMKWGRNVRDNISKFLQFQMTVNVSAVIVAFIGALVDGSGESPLKPVQLLWVNLIMDTLAALALATESPTDEVLERLPKSKQAPLISQRMWFNICGQAAYQIGIQLWLLRWGHQLFGVPQGSEPHLTIVFNVFVLLQLCNEFNARLLDNSWFVFKGIWNAPLFLLVVGATCVAQVLGVQYGGSLMRCAPLSRGQWLKCILMSLVPFPLGLVLRMTDIAERPVAEAPIVVDPEEEAALAKVMTRPHISLREAARRVVEMLRVVTALKAAVGDTSARKNRQRVD